MRKTLSVLLSCSMLALSATALAEDKPVGITAELMSLSVSHGDQTVEIQRNQNNANEINPDYALTSRPCPPFCIQPMNVAPGVETIGELELLDYLKRKDEGDNTILIVDSRTPDWVERGTIPGSINIPWTRLYQPRGATVDDIAEIMSEHFGALETGGLWDFSYAKTLVLFCNGIWCGQSPTNIRTLLQYGYPAEKLKWYRGGMQAWHTLGLTTIPGK